ncbi:MAG: isochorismatase family cysteine hydrolase [Pseudomonadota bacterium]
MKPAIIVIDMLEDSFSEEHRNPVTSFAKAIVPNINRLTDIARSKSIPVIFSMDSFMHGDFIFRGKMREHSIRGTKGAGLYQGLSHTDKDICSHKRRFSAFFKTDIDQTLRLFNVDTVVLTGINSHWCVLSSALDALSNDFRAYIIEDCSASYSEEVHRTTMNMYRNNPLYPLFKIMMLEEFLNELNETQSAR